MTIITREVLIFAFDNIFEYLSGLPLDLRRWNIVAWAITNVGDANAPTLFTYDDIGHMIPTPNRPVSEQERKWIDDHNNNLDKLLRERNAALDNALDKQLRDIIPFWLPIDPIRVPGIDQTCNRDFTAARNLVIRYDPLVLDLDGDGLELVGASGSILFDHNADGIKTGTGWARPDDGFLVRDLNGNGIIDTGRELFGVDTIKTNGGLATDGFDALRDIDTNGDGFITSADAAYADLRVWRDLDQNGISTSNELFALAGLGITSIGTNGTSTGPQAGQIVNNNLIALSTTYIRNGVTRTVGAIDLEANNFFTEFPPQVVDEAGNPVAITAQAQALPQMKGAGMVRSTYVNCRRRNWQFKVDRKKTKGHADGDI